MFVRPLDDAAIPEFVKAFHTIRPLVPLEVPPLELSVMGELAPSNEIWGHSERKLFLAEEGGKPVGRIAAIWNSKVKDPEGTPYGQLGYFECIDDASVCRALIDAATAWLAEKGVRTVIGPMNGGAHRLHRFQTSGFERPPFLFEPRNPSYYPRLFEACGFASIAKWDTYEWRREEMEPLNALLRARVAKHKTGEQAVPLDPKATIETLTRVFPLLDRMWQGHIGYCSLSMTEFAEVFAPVLSIMPPRHIGALISKDGKDTGCCFMFPDYVDGVRALQGDATKWGAFLGFPRPKNLVMHTLAFAPEGRGTVGSSMLLQGGLQQFFDDGYEALTIALVVQDWPLFRRFGGPTREYTLYGRGVA